MHQTLGNAQPGACFFADTTLRYTFNTCLRVLLPMQKFQP